MLNERMVEILLEPFIFAILTSCQPYKDEELNIWTN